MQNFFKKHKILLCVTLCLIFALCLGSTFAKYYALFHLDSFGVNISAGPKNYTLNVNIPTTTYSKTFTVSGTITEAEPSAVSLMAIPDFSVTVNDVPATVNDDGSWSAEISLDGTEIVVEASDNKNWSASEQVTYTTTSILTDNTSKIGYTGAETSFKIPATFYDSTDDVWYKVIMVGPNSAVTGPFQSNTTITSITIPDTVTYIGYNAFSGCTKLSSVTMPNCITGISQAAFYNCSSLTQITLPSELEFISHRAFSNCRVLSSLDIPDKVTQIGQYAFAGCSALGNLEIGSSVKSIDAYAFQSCTSLTSVVIPDNVTSMTGYTFASCTKLASVTLGSGLAEVPPYGFAGCTALTSIDLGTGVTAIGTYAFNGCTALTTITIPSNVTSIGAYAFNSCSNLATATLDAPTGWKAGTMTLQENYLSNPTMVARWLRGTYRTAAWTRS